MTTPPPDAPLTAAREDGAMNDDDDHGKWMVSSNEEHWDDGERFDTKEAAIDYARGGYAEDYGIEPGGRVYVGQIERVEFDDLAAAAIDFDSMWDSMSCWIHDNVGPDFADDNPTFPAGAGEIIEQRVRAALVAAMRETGATAGCFKIRHATSVEVCP